MVSFGPRSTQKQIVDGAAALGYLFSVLEVPVGVTPSWDTYWIPLLTLFSKCLYLAFIRPQSIGKPLVGGIPVMANVMYLPQGDSLGMETSLRPFAFGASLASRPRLKPKEGRD
jgi:hypothetical protein